MIDYFVETPFVVHRIIFYALIVLFCLLGFMVANRTFRQKAKNRKEYYALLLASPAGFMIGHLCMLSIYSYAGVIDSINVNKFMSWNSLIIYWIVVVFVGLVLGFSISFYMIRRIRDRL